MKPTQLSNRPGPASTTPAKKIIPTSQRQAPDTLFIRVMDNFVIPGIFLGGIGYMIYLFFSEVMRGGAA